MNSLPRRSIKSWISRQSALTPGEQSLVARSKDLGRYFAEGSDLTPLHDQIQKASKVYLDIGFGDGQSLLQLAEFDPQALIIGVEPHMPGVLRVLRALESEQHEGVRVASCDVYDLLPALPEQCLERVHLYFSDPWPKTRHHKRRLIQKTFWDTIRKYLKSGALVHIATDWEPYAEMIAEELETLPEWHSSSQDFLTQEKQFHRKPTKYERKAAQEGRCIHEFYVRQA